MFNFRNPCRLAFCHTYSPLSISLGFPFIPNLHEKFINATELRRGPRTTQSWLGPDSRVDVIRMLPHTPAEFRRIPDLLATVSIGRTNSCGLLSATVADSALLV